MDIRQPQTPTIQDTVPQNYWPYMCVKYYNNALPGRIQTLNFIQFKVKLN